MSIAVNLASEKDSKIAQKSAWSQLFKYSPLAPMILGNVKGYGAGKRAPKNVNISTNGPWQRVKHLIYDDSPGSSFAPPADGDLTGYGNGSFNEEFISLVAQPKWARKRITLQDYIAFGKPGEAIYYDKIEQYAKSAAVTESVKLNAQLQQTGDLLQIDKCSGTITSGNPVADATTPLVISVYFTQNFVRGMEFEIRKSDGSTYTSGGVTLSLARVTSISTSNGQNTGPGTISVIFPNYTSGSFTIDATCLFIDLNGANSAGTNLSAFYGLDSIIDNATFPSRTTYSEDQCTNPDYYASKVAVPGQINARQIMDATRNAVNACDGFVLENEVAAGLDGYINETGDLVGAESLGYQLFMHLGVMTNLQTQADLANQRMTDGALRSQTLNIGNVIVPTIGFIPVTAHGGIRQDRIWGLWARGFERFDVVEPMYPWPNQAGILWWPEFGGQYFELKMIAWWSVLYANKLRKGLTKFFASDNSGNAVYGATTMCSGNSVNGGQSLAS